MSSRSTRVRTKIAALLVSMVALWALATYVTVQAGLNLLWINSLDTGVGRPTDALVTALQAERRLSAEYLGSDRSEPRLDLDEARQETDTARAALVASADSASVRWAADDSFEQRIDGLLSAMATLTDQRAKVDAGGVADRSMATAGYTTVIESAFRMYEDLGQYASEIADGARTVVALSRARELLSQENAMITGIIQAQRFTGGEPLAFASIVAVQRAFYAEAVAHLSTEDRAGYDAVVNSGPFRAFQVLENEAIQTARAGAPPPFTLATWRQTVEPVLTQLREAEHGLANIVLARATPTAVGILVRLALTIGLGLIAVIASIVISVNTARRLVGQLEQMRTAAEELATYRLPRVVERLQHGERVDVEAEAPPLQFGRDEIGRLGRAFNAVQETAIQTAVDQAELRRSVRDVFLSLARRSQALLHRQLGLLDAMERRATDADELAELFRVDHLATRMRRNAENLIVLSGASAGRAWRRPIPMIDVVRGALAEVEDYTRVTVTPVGNAALIGRAVGDVIHLLAELIENAVSFSPPQTVVRVGGSIVGNGYAIEIEDRGLGMSEKVLLAANAQLRDPPEFKLSSTARLGLYVVAKLAERHGIKVQLSQSSYGGTTAVVLLPATLIAEEGTGGRATSRHDAGELDGFRPSQLAVIGASPSATVGTPAAAKASQSGLAAAPSAAPVVTAQNTTPHSTQNPATEVPGQSRRPDPALITPSGLPWRRKPGDPDTAPNSSNHNGATSGPNQPRAGIREQLSSIRSGTARGRHDAASLTRPELDVPDPENAAALGNSDLGTPEWTDAGTQDPSTTDQTLHSYGRSDA
jgi:signal transduction histidine kinase